MARVTVHLQQPAAVEIPPPRWGLPDVAVSVALYLGLSLGAVAVLSGLGLTGTGAAIVVLLVGWLGLGGWPVVVARRKGSGVRRDFGLRLAWSDVAAGLLGALVMFACAVVYLVVLLAFTDITPTSAVADVAADATQPWLAILALLVAFGAPLVEELHFRGLWYGALRKRGWGPWPVILLTAAAFGAFHLEWARFPLLFASGVVLGFLRHYTGRLGAGVVAHGLNNSLAALALLFSDRLAG